jgi:hypothetical protein
MIGNRISAAVRCFDSADSVQRLNLIVLSDKSVRLQVYKHTHTHKHTQTHAYIYIPVPTTATKTLLTATIITQIIVDLRLYCYSHTLVFMVIATNKCGE